MKIALLGGTFNPVHQGHLLIAQAALDTYHLDRVLFVPAGLPPHKKSPRTSARHRLSMLRLAVHGNSSFAVNDWEVRQDRVVYTWETLEHFRRFRPRDSLFFIIGSDSLKTLPKWREAHRLRRLCRFITIPRIDVFSSTDIRRRVRKGLSVQYLVPPAVDRYIHRERLYHQPE
jgi:nicotinate-nucleotide adenylyltransferase